MHALKQISSAPATKPHKSLIGLLIVPSAIASTLLIALLLTYLYNNISLTGNQTFARKLDNAIEKAHNWVKLHQQDILKESNIALIRMLQDIGTIRPDPLYRDTVHSFMTRPTRPDCWTRVIDPKRLLASSELNQTITQEYIDNKWILYAIAPESAIVTPEELKLFEPDYWHDRKLNHQLWALLHLRRTQSSAEKLDTLIEHLCERISKSQRFDIAVVDIYIQKAALVLKAGFPQKVRRRWLERIIANQQPDGGWNDKWFIFTSRKRPTISLSRPDSDQHATTQALWALYQVKYRYAQEFGLTPQ
jgi:hypothetical protein